MSEPEEDYGRDDYSLIHRSDIAKIGEYVFIWINGTQPVIRVLDDALQAETPKSPFPFARLACVTSQNETYLYHQINGTTFAEEQWHESVGTWGTTEYIHVTDL